MSDDRVPRVLPVMDVNRDWTKPAEGDPLTLYEIMKEAVEKYGDQPVFGYIPFKGSPRIHLSYSEFGGMVEAIASNLKEKGLKKGDRVAMILNNSVEWAAMAYAANSLGAAYTAMYTHQHGAEWAYIIGDSEPSLIVVADTDVLDRMVEHMPDKADGWPTMGIVMTGDESPNKSPPKGVDVVSWNDFVSAGREMESIGEHATDHTALATLIYTSGTTGNPKGVMLSNWNILHNLLCMQGRFELFEGDRTASFLPWAHSFGQMGDLHFMVRTGLHINLISDVLKIVDECQEIKPHAMFAVPRVWNRVYGKVMAKFEKGVKKKLGNLAFKKARARIAADGRDCIRIPPKGFVDKMMDKIVFKKIRASFGGNMRFCISGGAPLSAEVASFIQCVGFSMFEGYGLTETSPLISLNGWEDDNRCMLGTVGRAVPGVKVVIDQDAWDDPDSEDGEIVAYGPNIMMGYWNNEAATKEVIDDDGGFRTGDLGRLEDGFLKITGRVKEQFKLENGKYVAPSPLEESLKLSGLVEQCCVDGRGKIKTFSIIHPNEDALRNGLSAAGISSTGSFEELCNKAEVREWALNTLKEEVMKVNWKGFEISGGVVLDHEEWTTDNKLLTPSLKVKRKALFDRHEEALAELK